MYVIVDADRKRTAAAAASWRHSERRKREAEQVLMSLAQEEPVMSFRACFNLFPLPLLVQSPTDTIEETAVHLCSAGLRSSTLPGEQLAGT